MRVIVTGGRDFTNRDLLYREMNTFHLLYKITELAHGDARGVDRMARDWAKKNGIKVVPYRAAWTEEGDDAGPIRNQEMLDDFEPDAVIAFEGNAGTRDMVRRARRYKVPVYWLPPI